VTRGRVRYRPGVRTSIVLALALFLAACGGSDKPGPSTPGDTTEESAEETPDSPTDSDEMVSPEECEASGGTVAWDIGDGSVQCEAGFFEQSNVSGGVEAGLCCVQTPDNAE